MNTEHELIIARLDRIETKVDISIVDIATLKVKSGIWGAIAGAIPAAVALAYWVMT